MIGERTRKVVPLNYKPINADTGHEVVKPRSHDQPYYLLDPVLLLKILSLLYPGELLILWGTLLDICCLLNPRNAVPDNDTPDLKLPVILALDNLAH